MVFDYIDGDAGEGHCATRNREALRDCALRQQVLTDVSNVSLETSLLGERSNMPMIIGPTGLNGAYWLRGDECLARAAAAAEIPFVMSTAACQTLADISRIETRSRWFQLYMLKDRALVESFLQRIDAHGFSVLQLTVDTAVAGRRNRDIRNGFTLPFRWTPGNVLDCARRPGWAIQMTRGGSPTLRVFAEALGSSAKGGTISEVMQQQLSSAFTWRDLDWLRSVWKKKLVLKGILDVQDAERAESAGVDGIVVSNHGGRQLDAAEATITALAKISKRLQGRMTTLVDSGFRTGTDIAKALAMGADGVQLGRATLFGLASAGEVGVRHALDILRSELSRALALSGAISVADMKGRAVSNDPQAAVADEES